MRAHLLVAVVLLSGCASGPGIREWWFPSDPAYWEGARQNGAQLIRQDKTYRVLPAHTVNGLLVIKERIEKVSGVRSELALLESDSPNAFAIVHEGRQIIALSLSYIDALSSDWDALATTIGHELAHLQLGHLSGARKEREDAIKRGQAIGFAMDMLIPWSGTLASAGITAYQQSFTRDEERAADAQGLTWAIEAGYDACGHHRVATAFPSGFSVPFLSSHPGYAERSDLASEYALKATGKPCL